MAGLWAVTKRAHTYGHIIKSSPHLISSCLSRLLFPGPPRVFTRRPCMRVCVLMQAARLGAACWAAFCFAHRIAGIAQQPPPNNSHPGTEYIGTYLSYRRHAPSVSVSILIFSFLRPRPSSIISPNSTSQHTHTPALTALLLLLLHPLHLLGIGTRLLPTTTCVPG